LEFSPATKTAVAVDGTVNNAMFVTAVDVELHSGQGMNMARDGLPCVCAKVGDVWMDFLAFQHYKAHAGRIPAVGLDAPRRLGSTSRSVRSLSLHDQCGERGRRRVLECQLALQALNPVPFSVLFRGDLCLIDHEQRTNDVISAHRPRRLSALPHAAFGNARAIERSNAAAVRK
jgi:hypothetical protein